MTFVVFFQGVLWPFSCYFSPGYTEGELGRPLGLEAVVWLRYPALQAWWGEGLSSAVSGLRGTDGLDYHGLCPKGHWVCLRDPSCKSWLHTSGDRRRNDSYLQTELP